MFLSLFLASLLIAKAVLGHRNETVNLDALFRPVLSPEAEIFYPSWANWTENVQQRWTDYLAPSYLGAIKVVTVQDIQNIVGALYMAPQMTLIVTG